MFWPPGDLEHSPAPLFLPVTALTVTRQPLQDLRASKTPLKTSTLKKATAVFAETGNLNILCKTFLKATET
jgi:hypothetical protein